MVVGPAVHSQQPSTSATRKAKSCCFSSLLLLTNLQSTMHTYQVGMTEPLAAGLHGADEMPRSRACRSFVAVSTTQEAEAPWACQGNLLSLPD